MSSIRAGVRKLLENSQERINAMNTVEECQDQLEKLNRAAESYNTGLRTMASAMRGRAYGTISHSESRARIREASTAMAPALTSLYSRAGGTVDHPDMVTENQIRVYGATISGMQQQLKQRITELM